MSEVNRAIGFHQQPDRESGNQPDWHLNRKCRRAGNQLILAACATLAIALPAVADRPDPGSTLTVDQQKSLKRAVGYAKSGKGSKAAPIFDSVLSSCTDLPKCIEVASYTEQYGHQLADVRRAIMQKALEMSRTREDFILVALKSRQYECFEITRQAIQQLISLSNTPDQLTDLAHKAMEVSLNDVAHLAMEKEYACIHTVPEALEYAKQVHLMGMDDLLRKVIKDMVDDEPNAHQLCMLLRKIEGYNLKEMNRYLLKKALDQAASVSEFNDIWEAARRHHMNDIFEVAAYRGKKMMLYQKIQRDQAAYREQVQAWREQQNSNQQRAQQEIMHQNSGGGGVPSGF